jgi:DNA-directed RNA polymerase specialized sigma24 family protein
MLASRSDAEDVLQDAWLRWHAQDRQQLESAEAWLVTVVTRLCIDRLRQLQQAPALRRPLAAGTPGGPGRTGRDRPVRPGQPGAFAGDAAGTA